MSLSFEESLKKNVANNYIKSAVQTANIITDNANIASPVAPAVMMLDENHGVAAYSGDDGNWPIVAEPSGHYRPE